ncbi:MAG: trypsin-like peptidase domain-containing protein [Ruminococcus sp.]|nr:trypsin-like peptidase domain-containing protein [Ruminococcus sp.]
MLTNPAAVEKVLLGDVDGNKKVDINDTVLILQYLLGRYQADAYQFTAMDVNQDGAVTTTDALMVQNVESGSIESVTVKKELYNVPDQSERSYFRHLCSSSDATSKTRYSIAAPNSLTSASVLEYEEEVSPLSDIIDTENTNVVQLDLGSGIGSGFIVGSHVIATAAHCVYDNNKFVDNIKVNIYNTKGKVSPSNLIHTSTAKELHVPVEYVSSDQAIAKENFDYALIYVEDDLSNYGVWSLGVLSDSFMNSERWLTASGFRTLDNIYARYYSEGSVIAPDTWGEGEAHNLPIYRLYAKSQSYRGKSGGIMYYKSDFNNESVKSAVGVITGNHPDTDYSWAVRMNPNLIWFYKQNPTAGK